MELQKIKGNTYYIQGPTNIGIYTFKNKNCLLIDTGINNTAARKIDNVLNENSLHTKYILNTHSHIDHCGGNYYFQQEYTGCQVYASSEERLYMENTDMFSTILYSVPNSFRQLDRLTKPIKADFSLEVGINKINDEKFEVLQLPGHAVGHIGIITPEKVCFLGDSIFSEEILKKYKIPYLVDIEKSINTLNYLKEVEADCYVISHSSHIIEKEEILDLIRLNLQVIEEFKGQILELLNQPQSKEQLLESILILNEIQVSFKEYHLNGAVISAYLSYLNENKVIDYFIEDGKLYYFKKV